MREARSDLWKALLSVIECSLRRVAYGGQRVFSAILTTLAAAITKVISFAGYAGVAALMAVESACIPLPSEIIMPFAGYSSRRAVSA